MSLNATLATGILLGKAGDSYRTQADLLGFFTKVQQWYGDTARYAGDAARGHDAGRLLRGAPQPTTAMRRQPGAGDAQPGRLRPARQRSRHALPELQRLRRQPVRARVPAPHRPARRGVQSGRAAGAQPHAVPAAGGAARQREPGGRRGARPAGVPAANGASLRAGRLRAAVHDRLQQPGHEPGRRAAHRHRSSTPTSTRARSACAT